MFESQNSKWLFLFKSYAELARDVKVWCNHLPEFSAVGGIPRSGLLVANLISLYRNIPLISNKPYKSREREVSGPVLWVDDSSWTGSSIRRFRESSYGSDKVRIKTACYMCNNRVVGEFDHVFLNTEQVNHLMEWSTLHIPFNSYTMTDLDGVLCEDWSGLEEGEYESKYRKHVESAKCLIKPTYPLLGIVTSRLEKWRPETEAWLRVHGIEYESLYMNPAISSQERLNSDGFAGWKSRCYQSYSKAQLFIESSSDQAKAISFRTEKPVLDMEKQKLYQYGLKLEIDRVTGNYTVLVHAPCEGTPDSIRLPI